MPILSRSLVTACLLGGLACTSRSATNRNTPKDVAEPGPSETGGGPGGSDTASPPVPSGPSQRSGVPWSADWNLPADAIPVDVAVEGGRVLLSSYSGGLFEIQLAGSVADVRVRPLRDAGIAPPFGDARFLGPDGWTAAVYGRGLLVHDAQAAATVIGVDGGLLGSSPTRVLVRGPEIWVSIAGTPTNEGAVQVLRSRAVARTVPLRDNTIAAISNWIEVPERNSVFAASAAGIIEFTDDGRFVRLSTSPVAAIARQKGTKVIVAGGAQVLRWEGERFLPVVFGIDVPPGKPPPGPLGALLDLAIGTDGNWQLLFEAGLLVELDATGRFLQVRGAEDGIPAGARRLVYDPKTDAFVLGGAKGGAILFAKPKT